MNSPPDEDDDEEDESSDEDEDSEDEATEAQKRRDRDGIQRCCEVSGHGNLFSYIKNSSQKEI